MSAPVAAAVVRIDEAMLALLDSILGPVPARVSEGADRQATVILESAVVHATESIRRGRPGYARFQLESARFRAQRVLDGRVPADGRGGAR